MSEYYIGLMSGTSVDGIDAVLVDFGKEESSASLNEKKSSNSQYNVKSRIVDSISIDFDEELKQLLHSLCTGTDNEIEKIGVQKTFDKINGAGLVIALFDNNEELNSEDIDLINKIKDMPCIAVINKIDLEDKVDKKYITDNIDNVVYISAKQQDNIDELKNMIEKIAGTEDFDPSAGIIANERQRNAIRNAVNSLYEAKESLAMGMTMDAITVSLQETIDYLLELTGEKAGEEIVDSVFHNFCVGK